VLDEITGLRGDQDLGPSDAFKMRMKESDSHADCVRTTSVTHHDLAGRAGALYAAVRTSSSCGGA
jgi:hypothetical protein